MQTDQRHKDPFDMTPAELSEAVAVEVMGLVVCTDEDCEGCDDYTRETVPRYAEDGNAMLELWEHELEAGRDYRLEIVRMGYQCVPMDHEPSIVSRAPTAPTALCRAALLAARARKETTT